MIQYHGNLYFNFGKSIKRWISVLYTDISSAVIQSGFVSEFFSISRGCRQGDPSSPYIFLLCAEVLSLMIKQNKNIKGIQIDDIEYKLSQFADDTTVILDGTELSVEETIKTGLDARNTVVKHLIIDSNLIGIRITLIYSESNFHVIFKQ